MNGRFEYGEDNTSLPHLLDKALRNTQRELTKAKQEAVTDPLTGLFNRRTWNSKMAELTAELNRTITIEKTQNQSSRPLLRKVLIFALDLNRFKFLNDKYGHPAGDQALGTFANFLKKTATRKSDMLFRTGGDEFMIVCPMESVEDVSDKSVQELLERIQNALSQKLFIPVEDKGDGVMQFPITASAGHLVLEKGKSWDFEAVYKKVDDELSRNKQANGAERGK